MCCTHIVGACELGRSLRTKQFPSVSGRHHWLPCSIPASGCERCFFQLFIQVNTTLSEFRRVWGRHVHEVRNKTTDGVNLIRAEMEQKSEADELTDYVSRGKVS